VVLKGEGYSVWAAANADAAPVAVAIVDRMLPVVHGSEIVRRRPPNF
jgi:hypothetical protein